MSRFVVCLLCILFAADVVAQVNVCGTVIDRKVSEPLADASVIIKGVDGKIKKFVYTKTDGTFAMQMPSVSGCMLEVTMMGFAKQWLLLDSVSYPLNIYLETGSTLLKEVIVKAERIREQGDTITYTTGSFAQTQDRSIGDVLRRMPGIDVSSNGKIQYQGKDINKFYIEGSDLLGGKYGIATNGINHDDVAAVEVMENHQPMQVLSGMSFSDKAAINLKLKDKAKAVWSFHGNAKGGHAWQPEGTIWDSELFAVAVMSGFQSITTFKSNNIGEDLSAHTTDFFASRRETGLSRYVGVSLPDVPSFSKKRTLHNRSAFVSTNNLWKLKNGEFKTQMDYSFNHITAQTANITTYFLESSDRIVTENRDGRDRSHSLSEKFTYEVNRKTTFLNNTLQTNIDWDNVRLGVTGSLPNSQSAEMPDYYVSNKFKMIKRFNEKHLVTFQSNNEWESLPQTFSVARDNGNLCQYVGDHAFYTHESAAYAFTLKGLSISLEGGVKGYLRSLNTKLSDMPEEMPGMTQNALNTNYFTVYLTPRFEYWIKRVNITLDAPANFAHYSFDKALANRSEAYFSPSLSMNWKPNNRFSLGLRGGTGRSPMHLSLIQPGCIMTDYRTFRQGVDEFYNSTSQSVSASFSYKHPRKGVFANAFVMQSWTHLPYTMAQQFYGDYAVYSYTDAKNDGSILIASVNIGKTLDFMRGSANINSSFSRSKSHLISESRNVNTTGTNWSVRSKINGTPLSWLSFDYAIEFSSSRLVMDEVKNSWLGNMENSLLVNFMPHDKWEWHISGEHYRNELAAGEYKNVFMLDTKLIFRVSKRFELSAMLNNILNQKTYNYTTYSQFSSFESQRWLRGREFLISISLRK